MVDKIDENYFDVIDSPLKSYILGTIIFNIKYNDDAHNCLTIDIDISENIQYNKYCDNIKKIKTEFEKLGKCIHNDNLILTISSKHIIDCINKHLNVTSLNICYMDLSHLIDKLVEKNIRDHFIKAYIEKYGNILFDNGSKLYITFYLRCNLDKIVNIFNIPCEKSNLFNLNIALFNDVNVIDLMGLLYNDDTIPYINLKLYKNFNKLINNDISDTFIPRIKVFKDNVNAILPSKCRQSDAGYDITIIKEAKKMNDKTILYDTGIKLDIPNGYYVEIVPRSSISKSGFMLANSIGIIDQSYRGNIFIALTKIIDDAVIELPFKCCQMIIRKQIYGKIIESENDFSSTNRGAGGFGSTS